MSALNLRPLPDIVEDFLKEGREEAERSYKAALDRAQDRIKKAESTRLALALLDGEALAVTYASTTYAEIELGFFPSTASGNRRLAEAVRGIRDALGRLRVDNKDVADAKKRRVCVTLRPVDFPTVRVVYTRKLPKGARCRIVRHRSSYTSLVCEV